MAEVKKIVIEVDTGSVVVEIRDKGETIGEFKFNPNDLDIIKRYEEASEKFQNLTLPEDYTEEALFKLSDEIKDLFDYILNYKVADSIFCKCNPLTLTASGDFYCEDVLAKIAGVIESVIDQRIKKKEAKIKKATAKYAGK